MNVQVLTKYETETSKMLFQFEYHVYFVQYMHILDTNCEGQSDSQSNGLSSFNLKITFI